MTTPDCADRVVRQDKPAQAAPDLGAAAPEPASRRRWLVAAVASGAALTGAGLAWLNGQRPAPPAAAKLPLWDLEFPSPSGQTVALRDFLGRPLLLNFWATWCPPCVEEMPLLDDFLLQHAANGWQVLGLAADQASAVTQFLLRTPVRFPVAMAGMAGIALSRTLGNSAGGLPFTVVFNAAGGIMQRRMGRVSALDLQTWSQQR